ncbi:hypothetical protein CBX96_16700 [Shewanella sp. BC20]|uniref:hypothetical protein n=1 Tax=Shewanella sp. BC20 TaxID=2004459 RepID=UPI000D6484C4|nr:hypothetical protein [Shewanella sp. BC20]PWF62298.1 hypothetical protein CBX96_16700 [Shewanella sp. BC20]
MDEKYFWPLFGVFLGWVLTAASAKIKENSDKKRKIGNLLTKLIKVNRQMDLLISSAEGLKDVADSWEGYEPIRKGVVDRHFLEPPHVIDDLKNAIDEVSPIYPILAIELEDLLGLVLKNKAASLASSSSNSEAYVWMLSTYEVGLDFCNREIKRVSYKLAFKHGYLTFIRLFFENKRRSNNKNKTSEFSHNLMAEIRDHLKNPHNKSKPQGPSAGTR